MRINIPELDHLTVEGASIVFLRVSEGKVNVDMTGLKRDWYDGAEDFNDYMDGVIHEAFMAYIDGQGEEVIKGIIIRGYTHADSLYPRS